jgi:phosphoglycerate kinase
LGRPQGKIIPSLSLKPIGHALSRLFKQPVKVLSLNVGVSAIRRATKAGPVLLENIRFETGEDANTLVLAKQLARLGDIYVNEAFSVSHRTATSIVGLSKLLPNYAGLHLAHEVVALEKIKQAGAKPVVAIIGGAKVVDKLPVISKLLPRVKAVLVGGAVANTFLNARGINTGKSLIDKDVLLDAKRLLRQAGKKIILPIDVITDRLATKKVEHQWREVKKVKTGERIVDLGTKTCQLYAPYIKGAKTIFWSGTLGLTEVPEWSHASLALGRLVSAQAGRQAFVVVGGGDTLGFFKQHNLTVDHESLAGSAMLEFLGGKKLPGLQVLGY